MKKIPIKRNDEMNREKKTIDISLKLNAKNK